MYKNKRVILAVFILCVLIAGFVSAYILLKPKAGTGNKTIQVEIVLFENNIKTVEINTDAEYLRQALEEKDLIQGDESAFGLFVKTVDGVTADESKQEWWCFTKDGETLSAGVDMIPISDGDHYEITLVAGY